MHKSFKEIAIKLEQKREATDDERAAEFAALVMPATSPDATLRRHGSYATGKFTYAIKRAGRVREPFATSLLSAYSRYLSRNAYEHDFSIVREIDA